ncbi:hypothetical protein [Streptomyces sp. MJM1172]|uniref:hypothetical protein n=1 Tax=Streptomyces sp. MJM1172 TaxID=1703926 RepID=UPI00095A7689|nr:hypothetical protein [Streptomyces sp. MJM1172]OKI51466.1 hypothetical protein AMK15_31335 [Streptomyces sp. MJM1172]
MDIKRMRRTRDDLIRGIELHAPVEPAVVFSALCEAMARRHGRPVEPHLVSFPVSTVSGLLVWTRTRNLVLIEANTDPEHQLGILGHELWHMEEDSGHAEILGESDCADLFAPDLSASTVERIAARSFARTDCGEDGERACELFGSLLAMRSKHWLGNGAHVPQSSSAFGHKLNVSLGPAGGGAW